MAKSTSWKRGTYYRLKTKKWFQEKGYWVEYLELQQRIFTKGKVLFIRRDLAGADGLSMNGKEIIFWQSKFQSPKTTNIAAAIKEFEKYPFPDFVQRWVIVWTVRVKEPQIIEVK